MCSNTYLTESYSNDSESSSQMFGNSLFCLEIALWSFRQIGIIRFRNISHYKHDGSQPDRIVRDREQTTGSVTLYPEPEISRESLIYRINDAVVYELTLEEYDPLSNMSESTCGMWKPFVAEDAQLEFVMLDPYIRTRLLPCHKAESGCSLGLHQAIFKIPDVYGIFKFRFLYRRAGYSVLHSEIQVSVRPYKHDEYDRFISNAFPYYTSAISMMIAFFVTICAILSL